MKPYYTRELPPPLRGPPPSRREALCNLRSKALLQRFFLKSKNILIYLKKCDILYVLHKLNISQIRYFSYVEIKCLLFAILFLKLAKMQIPLSSIASVCLIYLSLCSSNRSLCFSGTDFGWCPFLFLE